jgi:hypothetical protein
LLQAAQILPINPTRISCCMPSSYSWDKAKYNKYKHTAKKKYKKQKIIAANNVGIMPINDNCS